MMNFLQKWLFTLGKELISTLQFQEGASYTWNSAFKASFGVTAEYPATSSVLGKWLATRYAVRSENKFKMAVYLKLVATRYAVWG